MQVVIENYTVDSELSGFTSDPNAHKHLFKHVIPLFEHHDKQKTEGWEDVIPDPPLLAQLERRRKRAIERLQKVEGCALPQERAVTLTCEACHQRVGQQQVNLAFGAELAAYVAAANGVLLWSLNTKISDGSTLAHAWRDPNDGLTIRAVGADGTWVIVGVDERTRDLRLITCYRERRNLHDQTKKRNLKAMLLELAMERAASRKNETYRELQVGGAS